MPRISPEQFDDLLDTAEVLLDNGDDFSPPEDRDVAHDPRLRLLAEINDLLAQDGGQAGTHAYDMMAAVEEINAGNARVLMELVAGVILAKVKPISDHWPHGVTFQASDIDDMQRAYIFGVKHDGMQTTVTLTKKAEPTESWQFAEEGADEDALEQAVVPQERPIWAVRDGDRLMYDCTDRAEAEAYLTQTDFLSEIAHVENRFCNHHDCPSTRCNLAEVTSDA